MEAIAALLDQHPTGYFCGHFHVYRGHRILLAWYDAFSDDPIYISRLIEEANVKRFASAIRSTLTAGQTDYSL
jgi:hypothetical protein